MPGEWRIVKRRTRARLVTAARAGRTIFYKDVAALFLDPRLKPQSGAMRELLMEISVAEHGAGRPLLSAIVVRTDTRRPGKGFEAMARRLKCRVGSHPDRFWRRQRDQVWKHAWR